MATPPGTLAADPPELAEPAEALRASFFFFAAALAFALAFAFPRGVVTLAAAPGVECMSKHLFPQVHFPILYCAHGLPELCGEGRAGCWYFFLPPAGEFPVRGRPLGDLEPLLGARCGAGELLPLSWENSQSSPLVHLFCR